MFIFDKYLKNDQIIMLSSQCKLESQLYLIVLISNLIPVWAFQMCSRKLGQLNQFSNVKSFETGHVNQIIKLIYKKCFFPHKLIHSLKSLAFCFVTLHLIH